jgi:hypothetical protein
LEKNILIKFIETVKYHHYLELNVWDGKFKNKNNLSGILKLIQKKLIFAYYVGNSYVWEVIGVDLPGMLDLHSNC